MGSYRQLNWSVSSPTVDGVDGVPALLPGVQGVLGDQGPEVVAHRLSVDAQLTDELLLGDAWVLGYDVGGCINAFNVGNVVATGCTQVAVIGGILGEGDPPENARAMRTRKDKDILG